MTAAEELLSAKESLGAEKALSAEKAHAEYLELECAADAEKTTTVVGRA